MAIVPLIGVSIAVAIVGAVWRRSRVRAKRRWKAALERFAELQMDHETL
jgi:hypothetical protein